VAIATPTINHSAHSNLKRKYTHENVFTSIVFVTFKYFPSAGGSPTVKKGEPRPVTKEFVFEKCSTGAVKTSASVTLAREP
jgi:hypothetical protein